MDAQDQWVIDRACDWLAAGQPVWLCTIVATVGAAPRPVGSLLALNAAGELAGSLSGGCVEDDLIERLHAGAITPAPLPLIEYGVTPEENERLGLPCGGRLQVMIEQLLPGDVSRLCELGQAIRERRCLGRRVNLVNGEWVLQPVTAWQAPHLDGQYWQQVFGPAYRLLLVGAGELARVLAGMACMMDYDVRVCDPRADRIAQWPLPEVPALRSMPDDAVRDWAADARSIVITLTHDPRIDDMALMEALQHDLFYVGALGSARTSATRRERLRALGLPEAAIARLHAPVGLAIGSKRPAEIAVAILAELTQLRSRP